MAYQKRTFKKSYKSKYNKEPLTKQPRFTPPGGWNKEFSKVFNFVENETGNGAIEAVAGGGKTTALVEAVIRYCEKNPSHRVVFVAFNKSIKEEGQRRLAGYPVDVMTVHGLGYRSVMKGPWNTGKLQFDVQDSKGLYMRTLVENKLGYEKDKHSERESLLDLISKAKTCLGSDIEGLIDLMNRFDIKTTYKESEFAQYALDVMEETRKAPYKVQVKGRGGRLQSKIALTYDDQCWLPVVNGWAIEQYNAVFVDEAQDLSPVRRELIKRALKQNGRMFVVGDRFQSIYSFAGADIESLPMLIEEFDCKSLPLSCSWRCAKSIVMEAQQFNPDITWAPNAKDGIVDEIKGEKMLEAPKAGDAIISRTNAPLVKLFFQFARRQIKVKFIGRDYGQMLAYRIRSWKFKHEAQVEKGNASGPFNGRMLLEANDNWLWTTAENSSKDGEEVSMENINDRIKDEHATVIALTDGLNNSLNSEAAVQEVLDRCNAFSPDEKPEDDGCGHITLSSTHRFKGLERDHVYMLTDTYKPGNGQEETNLTYTAITRARKHLTYVSGELPQSNSENS